jgi:hypothetical protein
MGRGTDKDVGEAVGPDGAVYRRGRKRHSEPAEVAPAVALTSPVMLADPQLEEQLTMFLRVKDVHPIAIYKVSTFDDKVACHFVWKEGSYPFTGHEHDVETAAFDKAKRTL